MDKAKKKQIKKITTWVLLAALVAGLAAMPLLAKAEAEADGPVASILSGTVEAGSVSTALHGGGTLSVEDTEEIRIPSGVKITEFLVKNGETVPEGAPLAAVDKVSVMTAITSVTETMEYLQEEMRSAKEEKVSATIPATAGGRIKKVFAQKGDSVQDVMLQHGALALLSLDGRMAVEIQRSMVLPTGESVEIIFPDETEVTGRVESNLDGVIIITLEDAGYAIGETVTVFTRDGDRVGSGELYVHNAWTAAAYSGTIQTVYAKEESKVSAGASLFALTDRDFLGDLEYLSSLHREYEALLQDLFQMYRSGTIDAPCGGTVSGVEKDSAHLLSAETENLSAQLLTQETTNQEKGWTLVLLSNVTYEPGACGSDTCSLKGEHTVETCPKNVCTYDANCGANGDKHSSDCIFSCDHADTAEGCNGTKNHYNDCIKSCISAKEEGSCPATAHHYLTCIQSCIPSDGTRDCPATGQHKHSCIEDCVRADVVGVCEANMHHYTDCIAGCAESENASVPCSSSKHKPSCYFYGMTYTATAAKLFAVGNELVVYTDMSNTVYTVAPSGSGWKIVNGTLNTSTLVGGPVSKSVSNPKAFSGKEGSILLFITGKKGDETISIGPVIYQAAAPSPGAGAMGSLGDLSALLGGLRGMAGLGGLGGYGFTAESPVEEEALFDLEGSVLMTVSPETTVSLTITLDEQDIAKVSMGQKAVVRVNALGEETFDAEVVEISNRGTNNGGSSKFTVKLRFPKTADMVDGMSATASLPLEEKKAVPTIPVAALAEEGTQTVVYTALDKEGNPANPVPVTVGLSDGMTAEILEGLSPGDPYCYSYYDVLEEDTGVEERFTLH